MMYARTAQEPITDKLSISDSCRLEDPLLKLQSFSVVQLADQIGRVVYLDQIGRLKRKEDQFVCLSLIVRHFRHVAKYAAHRVSLSWSAVRDGIRC